MTRLRNLLRAIFSPTRRRLGGDRQILQRGGLLGRSEWIVPRSQSSYRRIDLLALPPRQRRSAARIAILRDSPSPEASVRVAWTDGIAHVWFWRPPADFDPKAAAWIPESLLRRAPVEDGARLVESLEGVEGQVWSSRQLVASQWWAKPPTLEAWHRFLRASGRSLERGDELPAIQAVPLADRAWAEVDGGGGPFPDLFEVAAWRALAAGLVFALGWQLAAREEWAQVGETMAHEVGKARARAMPLLDAREQAAEARERLAGYGDVQGGISDYGLMAAVVAALPPETRLTGWRREGERLNATVQVAEADPRRVVEAYAKIPQLADVRATPVGAGVMGLEFTLPKPTVPGQQK